MTRQFELRRTVEVARSVEEVWQAVATVEGQAAWRFPIGGEDAQAVGDLLFGHRVEILDPPHYLRLRAEEADGQPDIIEYLVESQTTGVRLSYLHAGVIDDDDGEVHFESTAQHTDFYLHTLGQYLAHFSGKPVVYYGAEAPPAGAAPGSFELLSADLGIAADAVEGDEASVGIQGVAPIRAVIDYRRPEFLGLRSSDALYRFFGRDVFAQPVALGHHLFAGHLDEVLEEPAWRGWLDGLFSAD